MNYKEKNCLHRQAIQKKLMGQKQKKKPSKNGKDQNS